MASTGTWKEQALIPALKSTAKPSALGGEAVRRASGVSFLVASAGLVFVSLVIPGYVRPQWQPVFAGLGLGCLAIAAALRWVRMPPVTGAVVSLYGDASLVLAWASLSDRSAGQCVAALLSLPTLYVGLFLGRQWVVAQGLLTLPLAWVITSTASPTVAVHLLRTAIFAMAAICPAVVAFVLRRSLDTALSSSRRLATTDPLTGLANRRGLTERYPALAGAARGAGVPVGVVVADLDHFKQVNDRHGHLVGDEVLQRIAAAVTACTRGQDVVARLGGEELAIVAALPGQHLQALAERVRQEVERAGAPWSVTVSLGVVTSAVDAPATTEHLWALIDAADELMYQAKDAGRNRVRSRCDTPSAV